MFTEKSDCKGVGLPKNQYIGGNCLKKGGGQFPDFQGGLGKKEKGGGGVFEEEGWYPNAHYDYTNVVLQNTKPKKYVNRGVTIESTF